MPPPGHCLVLAVSCIWQLLVVKLDRLEHIKGSVPGMGSKPLFGDCAVLLGFTNAESPQEISVMHVRQPIKLILRKSATKYGAKPGMIDTQQT